MQRAPAAEFAAGVEDAAQDRQGDIELASAATCVGKAHADGGVTTFEIDISARLAAQRVEIAQRAQQQRNGDGRRALAPQAAEAPAGIDEIEQRAGVVPAGIGRDQRFAEPERPLVVADGLVGRPEVEEAGYTRGRCRENRR